MRRNKAIRVITGAPRGSLPPARDIDLRQISREARRTPAGLLPAARARERANFAGAEFLFPEAGDLRPAPVFYTHASSRANCRWRVRQADKQKVRDARDAAVIFRVRARVCAQSPRANRYAIC